MAAVGLDHTPIVHCQHSELDMPFTSSTQMENTCERLSIESTEPFSGKTKREGKSIGEKN